MKIKSFLALAALAIVLLLASVWVHQARRADTVATVKNSSHWLPNLKSSVELIRQLALVRAGQEQVRLRLDETGAWRVVNKADYFADEPKLRELLLKLVNAKVLEEKTSDPAFHQRLGVNNGETEALASTEIRLYQAETATPAYAIVLGKAMRNNSATVARLHDQPQVVLLDQALSPDLAALAWLDKNIIDITEKEIRRVRVDRVDEPAWVMSKMMPEQLTFEVDNLPANKALKSANPFKPLALTVGGLQFEDVRREGALSREQWELILSGNNQTLHQAQFQTFNGLSMHVVAEPEAEQWLSFNLMLDRAQADHYFRSKLIAKKRAKQASENTDAEPAAIALSEQELAEIEASVSALQGEVDQQAERLQAWQFKVAEYKAANLFRSINDYLTDKGA